MTRLVFDDETHTYTIDGKEVSSVTQLCRPLTVEIAENAKPWLRDAAAERGTRVHEACADIDFIGNLDDVEIAPDITGYVTAYLNFLRDYRVKSWDAIELPLGCSKLGFAGTIDRVGIINRELSIVDLKTGSRIDKPLLTAQLNGYRKLWDYNSNKIIKKMYGLKLGKDGDYRLIPAPPSSIFDVLLELDRERRVINGKQ